MQKRKASADQGSFLLESLAIRPAIPALKQAKSNGPTISAKNLGAFAAPGACERCLWVRLKIKKLPYQIFPGIFSSIDSYNKKVVHGYFNRERRMPDWLMPLGDIAAYVDPPNYRKFSIVDPATDVTLRGEADGIFRLRDSSYVIVDYKTATFTPGQEAMLPIYQTQLNGYAYIGERLNFSPISRLALIYMNPVTDIDTATRPSIVSDAGFHLSFAATLVPVKVQAEATIPPLLRRVRAISDLTQPPVARPGCEDCQSLINLLNTLQ